MKRLLSICGLLLAQASITAAAPALAQTWPSKPVRIVLQFPPGESTKCGSATLLDPHGA